MTSYTDTTNAFKMYRKDIIDGLKPFLNNHFNLTVELPLKVMVRVTVMQCCQIVGLIENLEFQN